MGSAKSIKVLVLAIIVGVLASTVGLVPTASAIPTESVSMNFTVSGGGINIPQVSLAVAAIFSVSSSSGAGAFSGTLVQASGGAQEELFSLTVSNPANAPVLHCPGGQVSASGSVTSGSFLGEQVLIAGCIGSGVAGSFIIYHIAPSSPDFSGQGTGTALVFASRLMEEEGIAAGVTSGSGSAGPGTIYTAEADAVTQDGSLVLGGAFVGTTSFLTQVGNNWAGQRASVQPSCTLTTSGLTASFGSFPNQPVSSTYTLVTCPPSSLGPQTARFVYVVGGETNPIYKGTGSAIIGGLQGELG